MLESCLTASSKALPNWIKEKDFFLFFVQLKPKIKSDVAQIRIFKKPRSGPLFELEQLQIQHDGFERQSSLEQDSFSFSPSVLQEGRLRLDHGHVVHLLDGSKRKKKNRFTT
jgi:hypothetical protein